MLILLLTYHQKHMTPSSLILCTTTIADCLSLNSRQVHSDVIHKI